MSNTTQMSRGKLNQNPPVGAQMMERTSSTSGAQECWTVVENTEHTVGDVGDGGHVSKLSVGQRALLVINFIRHTGGWPISRVWSRR